MTEDSSRHDELPDGTRDEAPIPPPPVEPPWTPAPAWPDTAVIEPAPTYVADAETTRLGAQPTTVDPMVPPPPPSYAAPPVLPVVPSWTTPSPAPAAPPQPPSYGAPQFGAPPGAPQFGAPQFGAPQFGAPQFGAPQYGAPQYGAPQFGGAPGAAQYRPGQYGPGQYGLPAGAGMPGVAGWGAVPLAPKPGVIPLRPLGVGEILDGAISYIRRDPKTVLGISAAISAIIAAAQLLTLSLTFSSLDSLSSTSTRVGSSASDVAAVNDVVGTAFAGQGAQLLQFVVTSVLGVVATGLLTLVMGRAVLGQRVTLGEAWKGTSKRFWPLLGLTFVISLAVGAAALAGILASVLIGWAISNASVGLGVFVGIVLGFSALLAALWLHVRLLLSPVALMLEGAGVGRSMTRSWGLVRGAWWRTFGIWLLASVIGAIVSGVLAVPFALVGGVSTALGSSNGSTSLGLGYFIATSLGTLIASTVVLPFSSGVVVLLYIDRRIRREALDIELARAAGFPV